MKIPVTIRVDRDLCMGSGSCQFFAPNTFDLDADCKAVVKDPQGDPLSALQGAASGCPTRAIELSEAAADHE